MSSGRPRDVELASLAELRPARLEDMPVVRHLHSASFKRVAGAAHTEEEVAAFVEHVHTIHYTDELLREDLHVATINGEVVGTAGWCPADDSGAAARIRSVFVQPLFTRAGLGRLLIRAAEARARRAGFREFTVQTGPHAVQFFQRLGYVITSHGTRTLPSGKSLPVAFMRKQDARVADDEPDADHAPEVAAAAKPMAH